MKDQIEHQGTVESTDGGYVRVRITQSSACAGCTARSLCQSAESKDKIVEVEDARGQYGSLSAGDPVVVCGSGEMGRTAVVLAFVVPLILMVSIIAVCIKAIGMSEPASIGLSFLTLALYYFVLWTQRTRIQKKFVWRLKK